MKYMALLVGGLVAGLVILLGELPLNFFLLAEEWAAVGDRLALPDPTPAVALQGVAKLLLLGIFSVWLAGRLQPSFGSASRAALASGTVVWFLVWAWVQWGMLLVGYVTLPIAVTTVLWGLVELPLAVWLGTRARTGLLSRLARPRPGR